MNLTLILPELFLTVAALGLLVWDLYVPTENKKVLWWGAILAALGGLACTFHPDLTAVAAASEKSPDAARLFGGSWIVDPTALFLKRCFAVAALFVFGMSREYVEDMQRARGEFWTLGVLALLGMFLCSGVNDFMSLFVCLEIVTVSFFVLAAYRRDRPSSVEAGLKLLVIGSLAAAVMIYGIAFVYGGTGTVFFDEIRSSLPTSGAPPVELIFGALLILLGLGFKTSAVPMHVWVPDVYQGAPTPVSAYLSVGSKLAGLVLVVRVLQIFGAAGGEGGAQVASFLALVAALTLLYGNLGAIPQTNVKRLMGYSSIGQCGYILVGMAASWSTGFSGALFYMASYVFMNLAAFTVIVMVGRATGSHDLADYNGLARRSPILALGMTVALLSLAGVPPFMGFFGKFLLLGSAIGRPELLWLGVIGLVNVVIALYFYLGVVKRLYVEEPAVPTEIPTPARVRVMLMVAIVALIVIGVAPQILTQMTDPAVTALGFPSRP